MRHTRLRAQLMAAAAVVTLTVPAQPAYAWKPKTHIYLAEQALYDALDNGKVTLYETDRATGRIIGPWGEFDVDPKILAALKSGQKQFRAGVIGPDAYPDILTGQQIIHPEEADAVDHGAGGSNAWLTHLWERGFVNGATPQIRAFTIGYLTHAAGDVFAHTYVNHYAGGEFMLTPDPTNAVKHLVLEGYIGKRTPQTFAATATRTRVSGGPRNPRKREDLGLDPDTANDPIVYENVRLPITQEDTSIAGVEGFIYDELTFAKPDSVLLTKLMMGEGTSRSIPFIFSEKRNQLQAEVDEYERTRMSLSGPARVAYAATHGAQAEYKKAWIADIDAGLKAFPATSHEVAKAIVYNEAGGDMACARDALSKYVSDHLISMLGFPDAAIVTVQTISAAIDAITPPFIAEFLKSLLAAPLDALVKGLTGKTADEWAHYMTNPEAHFDEIMNVPGGGHSGSVEHRVDLKTFNREQLKIDDDGYARPSLTRKIEDLPPAFNTLQLTKLMFLGDAGIQQLEAALTAKGVVMGASPGQYRNYMLGWVRSLDAGNQWQGLPSPRGKTSPQAAFAAGNAQALNRLFLAQVGEAEIPQAEPVSNPVPKTPPPPVSLPHQPVPDASQPRWWPRAEDLGNKSLMASYLEGHWTTELGTLVVRRSGEGDVDHWSGSLYRTGQSQPAFVLEDLVPSADASGVTGTWREAGSTQKRAIRLVLNTRDGDKFVAGSDGYIGGLAEMTGTRILNPPAYEQPEPQEPERQQPQQPTQPRPVPQEPQPQPQPPEDGFQPLGKWDVRVDKIENPREDRLTHVYITLRNASTQTQQQTGDVWVYLDDTSGASQRSGQGVRAIPGPPQLFGSPPPVTLPGKTIRAKYIFDRVRDATITKVTVVEGDQQAEYDF